MKRLLIIGVLVLVPQMAEARTWRVPSEHPSICGSVDSSAYGDTVLVAPGTYERERMVPTEDCWLSWIVMKDGVTLMSEAGAEETILVAATLQTEIAICCDSIADAQIIGFTIRDESHGSGS